VPELISNPYAQLAVDPETGIALYVRTSTPYPSVAWVERVHEQLSAALDGIGRARHGLLVDLREAPLTNDPLFEQVMRTCRPRLLRGFAKVAALVRTASGSLQVKRFAREDGIEMGVFLDEGAALAFLVDAGVRDSSPRSEVTEVFGSNSKLRPRGDKVP
jgi:hypothetical protein